MTKLLNTTVPGDSSSSSISRADAWLNSNNFVDPKAGTRNSLMESVEYATLKASIVARRTPVLVVLLQLLITKLKYNLGKHLLPFLLT